MKHLAWGSFAVLCLAAAFHLGAVTAGSSYVDHSATGVIALSIPRAGEAEVLDEHGKIWQVSPSGWVENPPVYDLPVPVGDVKFWAATSTHDYAVVTFDNHLWYFDTAWTDAGPWPGATAVHARTWGAIRAEYR